MRNALLALVVLFAGASLASAQCPGGNCPAAPRAPRMVAPLRNSFVRDVHVSVVRSQAYGVSRVGVGVYRGPGNRLPRLRFWR